MSISIGKILEKIKSEKDIEQIIKRDQTILKLIGHKLSPDQKIRLALDYELDDLMADWDKEE